MMRRCVVMGLSGALTAGTLGCSSAEDEPEHLAWLVQRATEVRELAFQQEVPIRTITSEQYLAEVAADVDTLTEEDLTQLAETYGRLGYFDEALDLRPILTASNDWPVATYNHVEKRITLIGDARDDVVIHELTHALQDQHFDLTTYRDVATSDADLTRAAVVEGDARLAQTRFYIEQEYGVGLNQVDWEGYLPTLFDSSESFLADSTVPLVFASYPAFAYAYGTLFCGGHLTGITRDAPFPTSPYPYLWAREDALFGPETPASTAEVILQGAPVPTAPGLTAVPEGLSCALEAIETDTLGPFYTYLLLYPTESTHGTERVVSLAEGWRGDTLLFVRDTASGEAGLVWTSAWADDATASALGASLSTLHAVTADSVEPRRGTAADGQAVWLENSGNRLVFVKNVPDGCLSELAEKALSGPSSKRIPPPRKSPTLTEWARRSGRW